MSKQTAVEWLHQEIIKKSVNDPSHNVLSILEQAKQMEKEQIMAAYDKGVNDGENGRYVDPEQYYNDNYGK